MHGKLLKGFLTVLIFAAPAGAAGRADSWHLKSSPHFDIYHEANWSPNSIALELERIYGKLRMNVSMFAPWMVKEKTKVYIYRTQHSYLNGEFNPPRWSKGLAYFATKTVVVYDSGDMPKLRATLAHELSHLYFPPQWLNEGLAVMMEDASYTKDGPWATNLPYFPQDKIIPLTRFFSTRLDQVKSDTDIGYWYMQAFGVTAYLFKPHLRIQFKNFCTLLRDGEKLQPALWAVYRIKSFPEFDTTWRGWVQAYGQKEKQQFGGAFPSASFNFKPVEFTPFNPSDKKWRK